MKLLQGLDGCQAAPVPGRSEKWLKRVTQQPLKPFLAELEVVFDGGTISGRAKFLFLPFRFIIPVHPTMLMPAPQGIVLAGYPAKLPESAAGQPGWYGGQAEGGAIFLKNLD